ncbi:MAG: SpoIID/LytB domain-containing protein [Flavobacteriales bacterium]|nr:SpoIID/LytB domain-containing protein [Flavobacteriales bacterium]
MKKRLLTTLPILWLSMVIHAQMQELQVGLLRDQAVKRVMVLTGRGGADILADGRKVGELSGADGLRVECIGGVLHAKCLSCQFSAKNRITVIPKGSGGGFRMRSSDPPMPERAYAGKLEVRPAGEKLTLVNEVKLEEYVAAVVLSEAGKDHDREYYKLQGVSCRTYALSNLRRHAGDGFELCDGVHCQVYKTRNDQELISQAVLATRGMVVVDASIRLVHATFHSNCGGHTLNAEDVWSKEEPYLRARPDSFCTGGAHARWERTIPRAEWLAYLKKRFNLNVNDPAVVEAVTNYMPTGREVAMSGLPVSIPLKEVRGDWKFNSAYFSIAPEGDQLRIVGRGFGHGVGLCQEGAMAMAGKGIPFTDILHHYYTSVHLIDLSNIAFFRDDGY